MNQVAEDVKNNDTQDQIMPHQISLCKLENSLGYRLTDADVFKHGGQAIQKHLSSQAKKISKRNSKKIEARDCAPRSYKPVAGWRQGTEVTRSKITGSKKARDVWIAPDEETLVWLNRIEMTKAAKKLADYPSRLKAKILTEKVRSQVPEKKPEHELLLAVFEQAVIDAYFPTDTASEHSIAIQYLYESEMIHLEILGIDHAWVRWQISKLKIMPPGKKNKRGWYEMSKKEQELIDRYFDVMGDHGQTD